MARLACGTVPGPDFGSGRLTPNRSPVFLGDLPGYGLPIPCISFWRAGNFRQNFCRTRLHVPADFIFHQPWNFPHPRNGLIEVGDADSARMVSATTSYRPKMSDFEIPERLIRNCDKVRAMGPPSFTGKLLLDYMARRVGWPSYLGKVILDIGCGSRFTDAIIQYRMPLGRYISVDIDRALIEWLSANVPDPRLSYIWLDEHNPAYGPRSTGLVCRCVSWVADRPAPRGYPRLRRPLRPCMYWRSGLGPIATFPCRG